MGFPHSRSCLNPCFPHSFIAAVPTSFVCCDFHPSWRFHLNQADTEMIFPLITKRPGTQMKLPPAPFWDDWVHWNGSSHMEARQQLALLFYGATQRTLAQRKLMAAELSRGQGEHTGVISQPKHLGRCEELKWDGITVAEWQHACLRGFLLPHQRLKFCFCPDCSSPSKTSRSSVWSLLSASIYSMLQNKIQKLLTFSRNWSDLLPVRSNRVSTRSHLLNSACCFSFILHWIQTRSLDFRGAV